MPLNKVQPGDPLRIPAETYNTFIDTARDFHQRRHQQRQPHRPPLAGDRGVILVKSASGAARGRFEVLGLVPMLMGRVPPSVRMGHVPVI